MLPANIVSAIMLRLSFGSYKIPFVVCRLACVSTIMVAINVKMLKV